MQWCRKGSGRSVLAATPFQPEKKEITTESITTMQAMSTSIISMDYACALDAHVVMQNCLKLNALVILRNFGLSCCLYLNRV